MLFFVKVLRSNDIERVSPVVFFFPSLFFLVFPGGRRRKSARQLSLSANPQNSYYETYE